MIVFLDFAPIEFMGGAERWILKTRNHLLSKEKITIMSVNEKIANIYGNIVLKRAFDRRSEAKTDNNNFFSITLLDFIFGTKGYHRIKDRFRAARLVYIKYELPELFILLYFGGIFVLKKSVAGTHTPLVYPKPSDPMEWLHKIVYESDINLSFLKKFKKVHVLNERDSKFLISKKLKNIKLIPNSIPAANYKHRVTDKSNLHILFVGELSIRKGINILIDVIKNSPVYFKFTVIGDGPFKNEVIELSKYHKNCQYLGYVNHESLNTFYEENDIVFLPSRFESFSLVILEGISHGLKILSSKDLSINLPQFVCIKNTNYSSKSYLNILNSLYHEKLKKGLSKNKKQISKFFTDNYSDTVILPKLTEQVFDI